MQGATGHAQVDTPRIARDAQRVKYIVRRVELTILTRSTHLPGGDIIDACCLQILTKADREGIHEQGQRLTLCRQLADRCDLRRHGVFDVDVQQVLATNATATDVLDF